MKDFRDLNDYVEADKRIVDTQWRNFVKVGWKKLPKSIVEQILAVRYDYIEKR